jgi:hypothetical protein
MMMHKNVHVRIIASFVFHQAVVQHLVGVCECVSVWMWVCECKCVSVRVCECASVRVWEFGSLGVWEVGSVWVCECVIGSGWQHSLVGLGVTDTHHLGGPVFLWDLNHVSKRIWSSLSLCAKFRQGITTFFKNRFQLLHTNLPTPYKGREMVYISLVDSYLAPTFFTLRTLLPPLPFLFLLLPPPSSPLPLSPLPFPRTSHARMVFWCYGVMVSGGQP